MAFIFCFLSIPSLEGLLKCGGTTFWWKKSTFSLSLCLTLQFKHISHYCIWKHFHRNQIPSIKTSGTAIHTWLQAALALCDYYYFFFKWNRTSVCCKKKKRYMFYGTFDLEHSYIKTQEDEACMLCSPYVIVKPLPLRLQTQIRCSKNLHSSDPLAAGICSLAATRASVRSGNNVR